MKELPEGKGQKSLGYESVKWEELDSEIEKDSPEFFLEPPPSSIFKKRKDSTGGMQNSIKFERDRKKAAREKQAKEASHYSSGGSGSGNLSKKKEKIKRSRAKLSEVVENLFELENTGDKASSRSIRITDNSLKCR